MTEYDEQGRPEPPQSAGEAETLLGFVDYLRATLEVKCAGLGAEGLRARVTSSTMTLGGLLKHMSYVEDYWFSRRLHANDPAPPWDTVDWDADRDWDWNSAADDTPEELLAMWTASVDRSRRLTADAMASGGLGQAAQQPWPDGRAPSLRWIVAHMIEEYGRHAGHADLLREAIDGSTGE